MADTKYITELQYIEILRQIPDRTTHITYSFSAIPTQVQPSKKDLSLTGKRIKDVCPEHKYYERWRQLSNVS